MPLLTLLLFSTLSTAHPQAHMAEGASAPDPAEVEPADIDRTALAEAPLRKSRLATSPLLLASAVGGMVWTHAALFHALAVTTTYTQLFGANPRTLLNPATAILVLGSPFTAAPLALVSTGIIAASMAAVTWLLDGNPLWLLPAMVVPVGALVGGGLLVAAGMAGGLAAYGAGEGGTAPPPWAVPLALGGSAGGTVVLLAAGPGLLATVAVMGLVGLGEPTPPAEE